MGSTEIETGVVTNNQLSFSIPAIQGAKITLIETWRKKKTK
jgi:hypothetical protein